MPPGASERASPPMMEATLSAPAAPEAGSEAMEDMGEHGSWPAPVFRYGELPYASRARPSARRAPRCRPGRRRAGPRRRSRRGRRAGRARRAARPASRRAPRRARTGDAPAPAISAVSSARSALRGCAPGPPATRTRSEPSARAASQPTTSLWSASGSTRRERRQRRVLVELALPAVRGRGRELGARDHGHGPVQRPRERLRHDPPARPGPTRRPASRPARRPLRSRPAPTARRRPARPPPARPRASSRSPPAAGSRPGSGSPARRRAARARPARRPSSPTIRGATAPTASS